MKSSPRAIKLWKIINNSTEEIVPKPFPSEKFIHDLLENNIDLISEDLLVIGREVATSYGGKIDLLCLSRDGSTVIIEFKKDKTPRDVVAQVLEYAAWVDELSADDILELANDYLKSRGTSLEEAFQDKFGEELPEVINESHRILIVAPELDVIVEKVINYLSKYGININAVLFNYYKIKDEEYIAKITLIPESITEERRTPSKRLREILWTEDLLKERLERLEDSALKARLEDLLEFSIKNNIFYKLYRSPTSPAFGIASKDNGKLKLSVSFNGSIHAYIGKKSLSRYSSEDSWKNFVEDLKTLDLLPQDFIKNIDKRESTDLSKKLDQLSDEEYLQFKKILEKHLRGI